MNEGEAEARVLQVLEERCHSGDVEVDHGKADDALVTFLRDLGFDAVADAYLRIEKWYA